jgi:hypothetical protein
MGRASPRLCPGDWPMSEKLVVYALFASVAATAGLAIAGASMPVAIAPLNLWAASMALLF